MSMVGVLMKQMAVAATCPVLVTVVRSMEIVMALVVDVCTAEVPTHDVQFWYKVAGAVTVTVCVIVMALAERIHQGLVALLRALLGQERDRSAYTVIGDLEEEDEETTPLNSNNRSIA